MHFRQKSILRKVLATTWWCDVENSAPPSVSKFANRRFSIVVGLFSTATHPRSNKRATCAAVRLNQRWSQSGSGSDSDWILRYFKANGSDPDFIMALWQDFFRILVTLWPDSIRIRFCLFHSKSTCNELYSQHYWPITNIIENYRQNKKFNRL